MQPVVRELDLVETSLEEYSLNSFLTPPDSALSSLVPTSTEAVLHFYCTL